MKTLKSIVVGLTLGLAVTCAQASVYAPSSSIVNEHHLIQMADTPDLIAITKEYATDHFNDTITGPSIMDYVKTDLIKADAARTLLYPSLRKVSSYVLYDTYHADTGSAILTKSGVNVVGKEFTLSGVYVFTKDGKKYKVGIIYYTQDGSNITPKNTVIMVYPVS